MGLTRLMAAGGVGLFLLSVGCLGTDPNSDEESAQSEQDLAELKAATASRPHGFVRCASRQLSSDEKVNVETSTRALSSGSKVLPASSNVINVYVHVLRQGTTAADGDVPDAAINAQLAVLNHRYNPIGFYFVLKNVDRTTNAAWFHMELGTKVEQQAKTALRTGTAKDLNLYLVQPNDDTLGWATFPWEYAGNPKDDGVAIMHSTLPGGSAKPYNEGATAVHEIGHWLGLFHTFEGGCSNKNDGLSDTPAEKTPSFECDELRDSCKMSPGLDPVRNFMDYSDDACLNTFSPQQVSRMKSMFATYRN